MLLDPAHEAAMHGLSPSPLDGTDHADHREQGSMIRRYIIWQNRHADDKRLRAVVDRANAACSGTSRPYRCSRRDRTCLMPRRPLQPSLLERSMPHIPQSPLDARATDRAAGVLLGAAVGDALGVPYEFEARVGVEQRPRMIGGGLGPYEPGEYSDDTQVQVCIARVAADGTDLRTSEALDAITSAFLEWLNGGTSDVGNQTRAVLSRVHGLPGAPGKALLKAARLHTADQRNSAGNGSLIAPASSLSPTSVTPPRWPRPPSPSALSPILTRTVPTRACCGAQAFARRYCTAPSTACASAWN